MDLNTLALPSDAVADDKDTLPSSGSYTLPTGLYDMIIKLAYIGESKGGAMNVNLRLQDKDGNEHRETVYISSGTAKGRKVTYTDQRTGTERPLPGYSMINQLCLCATGKSLSQQTTETKTVKIWDYDAKAEVPTEVEVIMSLVNQPIKVGLLEKRENKNVQSSPGKWVPGPEARQFNEIQKTFYPDGRTTVETDANAPAEFIAKWEDKFPAGVLVDSYDPNVGGAAATSTGEVALPPTGAPDIFA